DLPVLALVALLHGLHGEQAYAHAHQGDQHQAEQGRKQGVPRTEIEVAHRCGSRNKGYELAREGATKTSPRGRAVRINVARTVPPPAPPPPAAPAPGPARPPASAAARPVRCPRSRSCRRPGSARNWA